MNPIKGVKGAGEEREGGKRRQKYGFLTWNPPLAPKNNNNKLLMGVCTFEYCVLFVFL